MFLYCFKVLADVIAMWQMEKPLYWCFISVMADGSMEECSTFIKTRRGARHIKTQMRQVNKFNQLCHKNRGGCSNPIHGSNGIHASKQQQMPEEADQTSLNATNIATKTRPKWIINI